MLSPCSRGRELIFTDTHILSRLSSIRHVPLKNRILFLEFLAITPLLHLIISPAEQASTRSTRTWNILLTPLTRRPGRPLRHAFLVRALFLILLTQQCEELSRTTAIITTPIRRSSPRSLLVQSTCSNRRFSSFPEPRSNASPQN